MANKRGTGLLAVWTDVPADKEDDFNQWYNEEHIPELLSIPGILNAARYEAVKSGPKYLACYELEDVAVLDSYAFNHRSFTDWAKRASPVVIGQNFIKNGYRMIRPGTLTSELAASGMAPVLQIGRMAVPEEHEDEWNDWYNNVYTANYEKVPGCIMARRWQAVDGEPKYAVMYELENEKVPESGEWSTQRDSDPSNERMRSLMRHAPGSPGVWKKIFQG